MLRIIVRYGGLIGLLAVFLAGTSTALAQVPPGLIYGSGSPIPSAAAAQRAALPLSGPGHQSELLQCRIFPRATSAGDSTRQLQEISADETAGHENRCRLDILQFTTGEPEFAQSSTQVYG